MNLTIIGSTGGTGTQIVHRALDSGHVVTAVARDPSRFVSLTSVCAFSRPTCGTLGPSTHLLRVPTR